MSNIILQIKIPSTKLFQRIFGTLVFVILGTSMTFAQTTITLNPVVDVHLSSQATATQTLGNCTLTKLMADSDNSNIICLFDLSSIPVGATITKAIFRNYKYAGTSTEEVGVYRVTQNWTDSNVPCGNTGFPTYTEASSGVNWTNPGGDYDPTLISSTTISSTHQYYSWTVTSLVQDWVSGIYPNYGLIMEHISGSGTQLDFYSLEWGVDIPELEITYSLISLSASVTDVSCNGVSDGAIDLSVSGGTSPYTFSWSDGPTTEDRTNLAAGSYTVTVTDFNSNSITMSYMVSSPDPLSLSYSITQPGPSLSDGSIDLIVNGGSPNYTYSWSTGATSDKYLYLSDPGTGMDRIDPAHIDNPDLTTSSTSGISSSNSGNVADNFDVISYSGDNSTGILNWSGDWIETDVDGGGASGGTILVTTNSSGTGLWLYPDNVGDNIYREVDLATASTASLSIDMTGDFLSSADEILVEVSNNGGSSYIPLWTFVTGSTETTYTADLLSVLGTLTSNVRVRFRIIRAGNGPNPVMTFDNVNISYTLPYATNVEFIQDPAMCDNFIILAGQTITVTTYATELSGVLPTNPNVTATLKIQPAGSTIIDLTSPLWDGSKLTWNGSLPTDVTIPSGSSISLLITNNETNAVFSIDYDSQTFPSKLDLPTSTYIDVLSHDIYDAAYSGGNIITQYQTGQTVYIRSTVTDPFGFDDITGMDLEITDPLGSKTTITSTEVATSGCEKTYEYAWTIPFTGGEYQIVAISHEGTEGIIDTDTLLFTAFVPINLTKSIVSPLAGPYSLADNIVFRLSISNDGLQTIETLPLQDIFDNGCLEYVSATITPDNVAQANLGWNNIGPLSAGVCPEWYQRPLINQINFETNAVIKMEVGPP